MAVSRPKKRRPEVQHPKEAPVEITPKRLAEAFRNTFHGSKDGELVYSIIRKWGRNNLSSFVPGNPHATSFFEGMRGMWLKIRAYTEADPSTLPGVNPQAATEGVEQASPEAADLSAFIMEDDR